MEEILVLLGVTLIGTLWPAPKSTDAKWMQYNFWPFNETTASASRGCRAGLGSRLARYLRS